MSRMAEDFHTARRSLDGEPPRAPEPIGWDPSRTFTGNPPRGWADPWDSRASRNPYPRAMPDPNAQMAATGLGAKDIHARAYDHLEKVCHDQGYLAAAGDRQAARVLREAILRRQAVRQELGTGVVFLTDAELRFLEQTGDGDEAGVS